MMYFKTLFLTCVLLPWTLLCYANSLGEIRTAAEKIKSINGHFIQEKQMPILSRALLARGFFAYQRPASLRWEYKEPLGSIMLLYNGKAHRYIPSSDSNWKEDNTANLQSMDFILQEIANWLNGRFTENPMFNVKLENNNRIVMIPKKKDISQFLQRIELTMGDQLGVMKEVVIFETKDSFTRFTFIDLNINQPISPDIFQKIQ
jgi:outer membrane lipoprotein-sorting protein